MLREHPHGGRISPDHLDSGFRLLTALRLPQQAWCDRGSIVLSAVRPCPQSLTARSLAGANSSGEETCPGCQEDQSLEPLAEDHGNSIVLRSIVPLGFSCTSSTA